MMKMKLKDIDRLYYGLGQLSKMTPSSKKGSVIAFKIAKLTKVIEPDIEAYVNARNKINETYSTKLVMDKETNEPKIFPNGQTRVLPEFEHAQLSEFMALMNTDIEIDIADSAKIKFSQIAENYDVDADIYAAILPILVDDSDQISFDED